MKNIIKEMIFTTEVNYLNSSLGEYKEINKYFLGIRYSQKIEWEF